MYDIASEKTGQQRDRRVVFVREEHRPATTGFTRHYHIHWAADAAAAIAFLAQQTVVKLYEYVMVDTPEGCYGRDISGLFDGQTGGAVAPKLLNEIAHGTLVFFLTSGLPRPLWVGARAAARALDANGHDEAYSAEFTACDPAGQVIAAIFPRLPVGDYEIQTHFTAPLRADIRPGQVTELKRSI